MATILEGTSLSFDPHDIKGNLELMDRANEFKMPFFGSNEDGERVIISVNTENITVETFQDNGWTRENIYHRSLDNEELFHR